MQDMVGIRRIGQGSAPVTAITYGAPGKRYAGSCTSMRLAPLHRTTNMTRREHHELQRKLVRTRRLALEPTDALTLERMAQAIEDLEYQLLAGRLTAQAIQAGY